MQLPSSQPAAPNSSPALLPPWASQANSDFDIRGFLRMLQRRALVVAGVAGIVMAVAINGVINQPPVYRSSFRLLVEPVNADNNIPDLTTETKPGSGQGLDYDTQIQVLRSPELMAKLIEQLQLLHPGLNTDDVVNNLVISRLGKTKIIEISYQADDPTKVKAVLDQAVQVYLRYSLAERQTNLRQGIQFVEKQLPTLQERVDNLQDELQAFRQRYNFIDPDSQTAQISGQAKDLVQKQQDLEQKLLQARFGLSTIQGTAGGAAALSASTSYQALLGQLRQIETQIATELTRFQPQSLSIQVLEAKRASLLPLLRQEATSALGAKLAEATIQIQSLEIQQQALNQAQAKLDIQTQQLPILSRNYVDLQRELQIATDSLNRFQTSRETLQIQAAQTEIPWQLIQAPTAAGIPLPSNINRSLLIGLFMSLGLGIGAAMALEKLDSSFHTVEDLKAQIRVPVLGVLPVHKPLESSTGSISRASRWLSKRLRSKSRRRRVGSGNRTRLPQMEFNPVPISSSFMEAMRILHTNLRRLNPTNPVRSLVISSALPADGKSTVAFHLAQTAQAMGQKVLLVDTDLRRPQIHQWLQLTNQKGLSDVIAGNLSLRDALVRVYPESSFFILTAGSIPTDPTQLLASAKMRHLMAQFHHNFDLVIYDVPPLLGLADASLLASYTDGLLLIARLNKTDRNAFSQALESLKVGQVPVLGVVANGLQHQSFDFYNEYDDAAPAHAAELASSTAEPIQLSEP